MHDILNIRGGTKAMKMKSLLLILALALLLCACRPTPHGDVVVNKGEDGLVATILASPVSDGCYGAPATLHLDEFGTDTVCVTVDAAVVVPDAARIPVTEIAPRTMTADWMRAVMRCMACGRPIMTYADETPQTKDEILTEITLLQTMLANPEDYLPTGATEAQRAETIEAWQASLLTWQTAYRSAPEVFAPTELDLDTFDFSNAGQISGAVDLGKARVAYLTVVGTDGEAGGSVTFNNLDDGVGLPFTYDFESDFQNLNGVTITRDEAVQIDHGLQLYHHRRRIFRHAAKGQRRVP